VSVRGRGVDHDCRDLFWWAAAVSRVEPDPGAFGLFGLLLT
jgi:hypothetical protein